MRLKSICFLGVILMTSQVVCAEETNFLKQIPDGYVNYCGTNMVELLENAVTFDTDASIDGFTDGACYYFNDVDEQETVLRDFSITYPTMFFEEVEGFVWDLLYTANESVYHEYSFVFNYIEEFSEAQPVNMEKFNVLTEEDWVDLVAFDFDKSYCAAADDSSYYWMPVYYPDAAGGIYEDTVYIFVFTAAEGMDRENVEENPNLVVLDDYRAKMTMITEQNKVAEILHAMYQIKEESVQEKYQELSLDSEGMEVERLQKALWDLGYQHSSVDGKFGYLTQDAVSAYQADMGLEVTGIADSQLQSDLFDRSEEKELLMNWLENR